MHETVKPKGFFSSLFSKVNSYQIVLKISYDYLHVHSQYD